VISFIKSPVLILTICGLLLLPLTEWTGLTTTTASEILIYAIAALGFNLLLGYTGLVSFGHGIFFGVAAYAASIIQVQLMPGFIIPPMILSILFTTLIGVGIGFLSLRLSGVYFSLLTLSFAAMTFYIIYRWTSFTGGEDGYGGMERPTMFGVDLNDQTAFFYLVLVVFVITVFVLWRVVNSPFGSVLKAIRENSQRTAFIGYDVRRYRLISFTLSAFFVGIAGSMFPFLKYYIGAELVHVHHSGEILALTILGGSRHFMGPALGALFFILFRELLSEYTASWQLLFGLMFMGFILFSPKGLMGLAEVTFAPLFRKKSKAAMTARVVPQMAREVPEFLRNTDHAPSEADTPSESAIFECRDIAKHFGNFTAVNNVSLQVKDKSLQALIGPNGAGKTSLFNLLSGEYQGDSGELYLDSKSLGNTSPDALSHHGVARSFQITNVFPELTVAENIRLAVQSRHPQAMNLWSNTRSFEEIQGNTADLIEFLGLNGLEEVIASDLSYGGQRLLEIGLAVATQPRVLLLDEPLVGLAAQERERIILLIKSLSEYTAVLLIEHDIDRVFEFSDYVTVMNDGAVLVSGTPDEVRTNEKVQTAYLGSGNALITQQADSNQERLIDHSKRLLEVEGIDTFYGKSHILNNVSSPEQIACLGIGLVPQGRRLFTNLTVAENLKIGGLKRTSGDGVAWPLERIFEQFPRINERFHSRADTLSGGEQQMVAIARALSGNVQMLLMDEPFEGLSPTMIEELFKSVNSLRDEVSIVIIEHQLDLVLALADRAFILDRGSITHEGPTKPLLEDLSYRKEKLWV